MESELLDDADESHGVNVVVVVAAQVTVLQVLPVHVAAVAVHAKPAAGVIAHVAPFVNVQVA